MSERIYRSLFRSITQGFNLLRVIRDDSGEPRDLLYLDLNPAQEQLYGQSRRQVVGQLMSKELPDAVDFWVDLATRVLSKGHPIRLERYSKRYDRWVDVYAYSPGNDLFVTLTTNISERKRVEVEREALLAELASANQELESRNQQLNAQAEELEAQAQELTGQANEIKLLLDQERALSEERERLLRLVKETNSRLVVASTEANRRADAEQGARELAERAVKVRNEFVSIAAHELRTPITSLQGYAQLVVRGLEKSGTVEPARLAKQMGTIVAQSQRLTRLADQLLSVSRLEAGKLTISPQEVDLAAFVAEVVSAFGMSHPSRTIDLRAKGPIPASLDPLRFEQVLVNLLDNAVKFSPVDTPVHVSVKVDPSRCWATISVRDHGAGIPRKQRQLVFERFHQAHEERHFGGLGLGLYVSRQFVELHGGTIAAEAPSDGGTRLVVRIPLKRKDNPS